MFGEQQGSQCGLSKVSKGENGGPFKMWWGFAFVCLLLCFILFTIRSMENLRFASHLTTDVYYHKPLTQSSTILPPLPG